MNLVQLLHSPHWAAQFGSPPSTRLLQPRVTPSYAEALSPDRTTLSLNHSFLGDDHLVACLGSMGILQSGAVPPARLHLLLTSVDLTACGLTLGSAPTIVALIGAAPHLERLFLGQNFNSGSAPLRDDAKHRAVSGAVATTTEMREFVDRLVEVWAAHSNLCFLVLDPWLVRQHRGFQDLKRKRLVAAREASARAILKAQELESGGTGSPSADLTRAQLAEEPLPFQLREIPSQLLEAAEFAATAEFRERLVQLQLRERKDRDQTAKNEGIAREKLRQLVRQRLGSLPPEDHGPSAAKRQVGPPSSRAASSAVGAMSTLEAELRGMIEQKQLDAWKRLLTKAARR